MPKNEYNYDEDHQVQVDNTLGLLYAFTLTNGIIMKLPSLDLGNGVIAMKEHKKHLPRQVLDPSKV